MTTRLEELFRRAAALAPELQDRLAEEWLAELEDEQRWDEAFAKTGDVIDRLAEQALREHREGKTIAKGIDEL